jgi:hypothetical protein
MTDSTLEQEGSGILGYFGNLFNMMVPLLPLNKNEVSLVIPPRRGERGGTGEGVRG